MSTAWTGRTNTSDRGLLGHSLGGLFAIYAFEQRPALFQRIVAASPALTWDNGRMLTEARRALRSMSSPVRLDLSVGSADELGFAKPTTYIRSYSWPAQARGTRLSVHRL